MTCTVEAYMARVTSYMGYHEVGENITPFGAWYGPGFQGAPWCDMFVSKCAEEAGGADIIGRFAWTPAHAQWFANQGRFGTTPRRGAIGFMDFGGSKSISAIDHVNTVESVDPNGQAVTIDGNYDDRVARWRHPMRTFVGFGYPNYAPSNVSAGSGINSALVTKTVSLQKILVAIQIDGDPRSPDGSRTGFADDVYLVERAMYDEGDILLDPRLVDGSAGTSTFGSRSSAYARWQYKCGYRGADADGIPGMASLTALGKRHGWRAVA